MVPFRSPMASEALITKFITIWRSWVASASTAGRFGAKRMLNRTFLEIETSNIWAVSRTKSVRLILRMTNRPRPE
jgi:hypothetical protein